MTLVVVSRLTFKPAARTITPKMSLFNQCRQLSNDSRGVSTIIGVILMVAVVIVLAGGVGAYVVGFTDELQGTTAPSADIAFEYDPVNEDLAVYHDGGDPITPENTGKLSIVGAPVFSTEQAWGPKFDSSVGATSEAGVDERVEAGDKIYDTADDPGLLPVCGFRCFDREPQVTSGDTVKVIWHSPDGERSQELGSYTAP